MSCKGISRHELDRTMPVSPPTVNRKINPSDHRRTAPPPNLFPNKVANHLNTLIPVGTAMIIVVAVKYLRESVSMPTVNMWWAHTTNPNSPILSIAYSMPKDPNVSSFCLRKVHVCEMMPNPGRIRI